MPGSQARPRRRGRRVYRGPARSCQHCHAWGILRGRLCRGCGNFAATNPTGRCRVCRRADLPVQDGVCRLCRKQAGLIAGPDNKTTVDLTVAARTGQQLFLAELARSVRLAGVRARRRPVPSPPPNPRGLPRAAPGWAQQLLFDWPRDCRHVSSLDPPRDRLLLQVLLAHAERLSEHDGWPARTLAQVCRGLRMLAASHDPGEPVHASTVAAMSAHGVPTVRVLQVLASAGDGLIIEDRPDSLTVWIDQAFASLPPRIRQELDVWVGVLREGTTRRRARPRATVITQLAAARPFLLERTTSYATLRQVTRQDVTGWLDGRKQPASDLSALRDLFGVLKTQRLVFADPTGRIRAAGPSPSTPAPLSPQALATLGQAARTDPVLRVVLALIGVQALHPHQARQLQLDHLDLPNRQLHLDTGSRPLDPFTADAIAAYLDHRRQRWPNTANPHLLLTRRTAHEHGPVSAYWLERRLDGLPVTLRQLREDRILEEASVTGGDPLHLTVMFGLTAKPALRYAQTVRPQSAEAHQRSEPTGP